MATLTESIKRDQKALYSRRHYEAVNREALKSILSDLKYLYAKGEISDKAYEVLVSEVISIFVENTISLKMEKIFDAVDKNLREASEIFLSDSLS